MDGFYNHQLLTAAELARVMQGKTNQKAGSTFEDRIIDTFEPYLQSGKAWLWKVPVPTVPTKNRDPLTGAPLFRLAGQPPFDISGYLMHGNADEANFGGLSIGAECKASSTPQTSLPIISPRKSGTGLQYHQLEALANLARAGGVARLLWDNGGHVCQLMEPHIIVAHEVFLQAYTSELAGKSAPVGAKSIKADLFVEVKDAAVHGTIILDWLSES